MSATSRSPLFEKVDQREFLLSGGERGYPKLLTA